MSFQVEVQFAAVSPMPALAQAEALARLELAVEEAGGLLGVSSVTSVVGLYEPPAPAGVERRGKGRG